jgi:CxxC motif-containing protein
MEKVITCINCPIGCRMTVNVEDGKVVSVTGNSCKRGVEYAAQESVAPKRMVTAVVAVAGRKTPVSVRTRTPIPKEKIFDCMKAVEALAPKPPVHMGDVLCPDVCGTGVDVIATKTVE